MWCGWLSGWIQEHEFVPLFGQLENIWFANEEIIFEYTPLRTLEFCSSLMAYKVEKISDFSSTGFCLYYRMLDFNIYSSVELNTGLYISLKITYLGSACFVNSKQVSDIFAYISFYNFTHVHCGFKGVRGTVAAYHFRIEHVVKLVNSCANLNGDIDEQAVFRMEGNGTGMSVFLWHWV